MSNTPLVSIITPSFNQGDYLEKTILSVLSQDYQNIEYIIIDGGSTDKSVEILKKYDDKIAFWASEPDKGQTDAIIKGFNKANGSFLSWLCSDDLIEPSMIKLSVHFLSKFPEVGLTFGDRIRIDRKGNIYSSQRYPQFRNWHLKWGLTLPQETVLFKREIYEKTEGLNPSLQMVMDYDLWCKMSKITKFFHIPTFLGRFRAHSESKSTIFSDQVDKSHFIDGFPSEFSRVIRRHFNKDPSSKLMKYGSQLRFIKAILERRTSAYKRMLQEVNEVRSRPINK